MASAYPAGLDTLAINKADATATATDHAAHHNDLADAVNKIEAELGVNPSGSDATVAARLAVVEGIWVPIFTSHVNLVAATAGTYGGHNDANSNLAMGFAQTMHYIDPADYAISGRTMKMRVVASFAQNATANAGTSVATAGLYPISVAGTTATWTPSLGTVVAGSTAARTGGGASSEARVVSSTFTAPTADTYCLGVAVSVATTAGATKIGLRLEYSYA